MKTLVTMAVALTSAAALAAETMLKPTESEWTDRISVADGDVLRIDLSDYAGSAPCRFSGGIRTVGSGKVVISGADSILFGAEEMGGEVHYPLFSGDVGFDSDGGKVVFDGYATIERVTSAYEIAAGSWIALWGTDPLGNGTAPFRVENYDVQLLCGTALNPSVAITVAAGRTLRIKPCGHKSDDYFLWDGDVSGTIANDIVLESGSTLDLRSFSQLDLTGDVTGEGTLVVKEGRGGNTRALMSGEVSFTGPINILGGQLVLARASVGEENPVTVTSVNGTTDHHSLSLVPEGDASAVSVASFVGNHENAMMRALADQTVRIGSLSGTAELRGASATTSAFVVERAESGSTIYVRNCSQRVTVLGAGDDVSIVARLKQNFSGPLTLSLPADKPIASLMIEGGVTVVIESGMIGDITGTGSVVARGDCSYGTIANTVDLTVEAGVSVSTLDDGVLDSALGDLPALWLDASRADTMQEYSYNGHFVPEGTFPGIVVRRWNDCRGGDDRRYAVNARCSTGDSDGGYIRALPHTITNALNGMTVLSFGTFQGAVTGMANEIHASGVAVSGSSSESRRLVFDQPITNRMVIMVFGSQDGGGQALVGGYTDASFGEMKHPLEGESIERSNQNSYYARNAGIESTVLSSTRKVPFWMDGQSVDPRSVKLNGGYQILSMGVADSDTPAVRSLGMKSNYQSAGGQRYAEVLVYTNDLTQLQRAAVETYLARKWGLLANYRTDAHPRNVALAEGASFESRSFGALTVNGGGSVTIGGEASVEGGFTGSVTLRRDGVLRMPSRVEPWTEEQVAAVSSRVGWFDPSCADDLLMDVTGRNPTRVHAVFDHGSRDVAGTPYLHGAYADDSNDRRPRLAVDERGMGWIDLTDIDDKKGDNLRVKTNHALSQGGDWSNATLPVKTAFIVMDSSKGGGVPIIDKSSPNTDVKARDYWNHDSPIWGNGTATYLTGGETRLNGMRVDGSKSGFTGGPELFSFTTDDTKALAAGFFGFYNAMREGGCEILGEIMLFSTVLDAATRENIERYLMVKWLGDVPSWRGSIVSGCGRVVADQPRSLPSFTDDFNGVVELTAEGLEFTLDGVSKAVLDAVSVSGELRLAETGTLSLTFADGRPKGGAYTLATFGALAEPGLANWTLPTQVDGRNCRVCVLPTSVVALFDQGSLIILR